MRTPLIAFGLLWCITGTLSSTASLDCKDIDPSSVCREKVEDIEQRNYYRSLLERCSFTIGACDDQIRCQTWDTFTLACATVVTAPMNVWDAMDYCESHGGQLATPINMDEVGRLEELVRNANVSDAWIGIYAASGYVYSTETGALIGKEVINLINPYATGTEFVIVQSAGGLTQGQMPMEKPFICSRLPSTSCNKNPCGENAYCKYSESGYSCVCATGYFGDPHVKCAKPCVCKAIGDPHYTTYDGEMINFMGSCKYILSESIDQTDKNCSFKVEAKNEDRRVKDDYTFDVSWTKMIVFTFRGKTVEIRKNGVISYDGIIVTEVRDKDMTINRVGTNIMEIIPAPECKIHKITFDATNAVIELDRIRWQNKIEGICGDCNGDSGDDLVTRDGIDVSKRADRFAAIGNSWKTPLTVSVEECDDHNKYYPECTNEETMEIQNRCKAFLVIPSLNECAVKYKIEVVDILGSCGMDNCAFLRSSKSLKYCEYYAQVADTCRNKGIRSEDWRITMKCPMECPDNSNYTYDLPKGEESCADEIGKVECDDDSKQNFGKSDREGCICNNGYRKSGGECLEHCGCLDGDTYHNKHTKWLSKDCKTEYVCNDTNLIINNPKSCVKDAHCGKKSGAPTCLCDKGFNGDGFKLCEDIDECETMEKKCSRNGFCINTVGSFQCKCNEGYKGDGKICVDIDECAAETDDCGPNADCANSPGSFTCRCKAGYVKQSDGRTCKDINECEESTNKCDKKTEYCHNLKGDYECKCLPGFSDEKKGSDKTGPKCVDIDECATNSHSCDSNAECKNDVGSYNCVCKEGYAGDGFTCQDVDECESKPCQQKCENTVGSFVCSCEEGYNVDVRDKAKCVDINECERKPCHEFADCTNSPGSYDCRCKRGYRGNGIDTCEIIDVCKDQQPCEKYKQMECKAGAPGEYECICKSGFTSAGRFACKDIDECTMKKACCDNQDCKNYDGGYACLCKSGTRRRGKECIDIDECTEGDNKCDKDTTNCVNVPMTYECECKKGYARESDHRCKDIDECSTSVASCSLRRECRNTPGAWECNCRKGYVENKGICVDEDECITGNHNCAKYTAECINTIGSYRCKCIGDYTGDGRICTHKALTCDGKEVSKASTDRQNCNCSVGYVLTYDGTSCYDINECVLDTKNPLCDKNAYCENLDGSFLCKCKEGFCGTGGPGECHDDNECTSGLSSCHENAECMNTVGSYKCQCKTGFVAQGNDCVDVDECASEKTNDCENARCFNTEGNYVCNCSQGYIPDKEDKRMRRCVDEDECNGAHKCNLKTSMCVNLPGSYKCNCLVGYKRSSRICENIDECEEENPCSQYATCMDTIGSYSCKCKDGFEGDGTKCVNINECTSKKTKCHENAKCKDNVGDYTCSCKIGYKGDGFNCTNIDECAEKTAKCDENSQCVDTDGGFECECNKFYEGNGKDKCVLILIDECASKTDDCDDKREDCKDLPKGFQCDCKDGYEKAGDSCEDINECIQPNICNANATCTNSEGSYRCLCKVGYTGTGDNCVDIDECTESSPKPHNCDTSTSVCHNTIGSYECKCSEGYRNLDTMTCVDIDECEQDRCDADTSKCFNYPGSFKCECKNGYVYDSMKTTSEKTFCMEIHEIPSQDTNDPAYSFYNYF